MTSQYKDVSLQSSADQFKSNNSISYKTPVTHAHDRIFYVDPNNTNGSINGVPVTPDYSDFCIGFDLMVRVVPRVKKNDYGVIANNSDLNTSDDISYYAISWVSN